VLGGGYAALPIGITVEGANILTRSMIVFGQGAIRCHPFVQEEMTSAGARDLARFDRAFFGHVGFVVQNVVRTSWLALTSGIFLSAPVRTAAAPFYRRATRISAAFALAADLAMGTLGGTLKRKEALTGRLADVHAWLYLASAALKRFHDEGSKERDLPLLRWSCQHALHEAEEALLGFCANLPLRPAAWLLRLLAFPLGRCSPAPSDASTHRAGRALLDGNPAREHLTQGIFLPPRDEEGLGQLESALEKVVRARAVLDKVQAAVKAGQLEKKPAGTLIERALAAGVIGAGERAQLDEAERARAAAVAVDSFPKRRYAELSA
jgi:acyl-CoA dehydrogenase